MQPQKITLRDVIFIFIGIAFTLICYLLYIHRSLFVPLFSHKFSVSQGEYFLGMVGLLGIEIGAFVPFFIEFVKQSKKMKIIMSLSMIFLTCGLILFGLQFNIELPNEIKTSSDSTINRNITPRKGSSKIVVLTKKVPMLDKNKVKEENTVLKKIDFKPDKVKLILCYQDGQKYYYDIAYINGNSIPDTIPPESLVRQRYLMKRSKNATYYKNDTLYKCSIYAGDIIEFNPLVFTRDAEGGKTYKYEVNIIPKQK
jgi:hypothetical protein